MMGLSFVLAIAIALPCGIVAALRPRTATDTTINLVAFAGISIPPFWLAILLIIAFAVVLGWLPAGGMPPSDAGMGARAAWVMRRSPNPTRIPIGFTVSRACPGAASSGCTGRTATDFPSI